MKSPAHKGFGRRLFLKAAGLFTFLLSIPSQLRAFFVDEFYVRTVEKDNFRFDPKTATIRWTEKKLNEPYQLTIEGLVEQPVKLSYAQLRAISQSIQTSDFHCVEGWSVADVRWSGFLFQEILKKVKLQAGAEYVIFHALGETIDKPGGQAHYIESFPLKELLDPKNKCLMTLDMNGSPLPHDHGAPLRLIAPYSFGYKNIKYITRIEFARQPRPGWWTLANPVYAINAPVPRGRLRKK